MWKLSTCFQDNLHLFFSTEIAQYLQKRYNNMPIKEIKKKRTGYEVELSNGLDLEFNSKGKFLRIDD